MIKRDDSNKLVGPGSKRFNQRPPASPQTAQWRELATKLRDRHDALSCDEPCDLRAAAALIAAADACDQLERASKSWSDSWFKKDGEYLDAMTDNAKLRHALREVLDCYAPEEHSWDALLGELARDRE